MAMRGRSTPTVLSEIRLDEGSCGQSQLESFLEDRDKVRLESNSLRHTKRWELCNFSGSQWVGVAKKYARRAEGKKLHSGFTDVGFDIGFCG